MPEDQKPAEPLALRLLRPIEPALLYILASLDALLDWLLGPMALCGRRACRESHCPACEVGHVHVTPTGVFCDRCQWSD